MKTLEFVLERDNNICIVSIFIEVFSFGHRYELITLEFYEKLVLLYNRSVNLPMANGDRTGGIDSGLIICYLHDDPARCFPAN